MNEKITIARTENWHRPWKLPTPRGKIEFGKVVLYNETGELVSYRQGWLQHYPYPRAHSDISWDIVAIELNGLVKRNSVNYEKSGKLKENFYAYDNIFYGGSHTERVMALFIYVPAENVGEKTEFATWSSETHDHYHTLAPVKLRVQCQSGDWYDAIHVRFDYRAELNMIGKRMEELKAQFMKDTGTTNVGYEADRVLEWLAKKEQKQ